MNFMRRLYIAFGFSAGHPLGEGSVKSQAQQFGGQRPTNGLTGLGIEPLVGRRKPKAVLFFWYFSCGQAKEKYIKKRWFRNRMNHKNNFADQSSGNEAGNCMFGPSVYLSA
jgi:hypothetical protein